MLINNNQNHIVKVCFLIVLVMTALSFKAESQLVENSKIFLAYKNIDGESNENGGS